jgi:ABC-type transporter Mla subunit MlaD
MRIFGIAVAVAIALAAGAAIGLSFIQETSAKAYSTSATRLNQEERVNIYGRQPT